MKKPKPPEQVYREYLEKGANYRKVNPIPACCGTCRHFCTATGGFGECNVGDICETRCVESGHVCDFYVCFDK